MTDERKPYERPAIESTKRLRQYPLATECKMIQGGTVVRIVSNVAPRELRECRLSMSIDPAAGAGPLLRAYWWLVPSKRPQPIEARNIAPERVETRSWETTEPLRVWKGGPHINRFDLPVGHYFVAEVTLSGALPRAKARAVWVGYVEADR